MSEPESDAQEIRRNRISRFLTVVRRTRPLTRAVATITVLASLATILSYLGLPGFLRVGGQPPLPTTSTTPPAGTTTGSSTTVGASTAVPLATTPQPAPPTSDTPRPPTRAPAPSASVAWSFDATEVPRCSHISGRGTEPRTGHAVIFVEYLGHERYYWERPIEFTGTTWVASRVTVGGPEDTGMRFRLHAVVVDDDELAELNKHNGTEYYLPNATLSWPVGPTLGVVVVDRTDQQSTC